jgi:hypothetical protein
MGRVDDDSPRARLNATADLCGGDLILECERAASRRNPRDRDPKRWSKTGLAPLPLHGSPRTEPRRLGADLRTIAPQSPKARRPIMDGGHFHCGSDDRSIGSCPLECRDHPEKTTPWRQDRDDIEQALHPKTKYSRP